MKFNLIMLVLSLCIDLILGSIANNSSYWEDPLRFCGSNLAIELSIICKGRYNEDPRSHRPKPKRAIVDECCKKSPCTRSHLKLHYCPPEPKMSTTTTTTTTSKPTPETLYYVNYFAYHLDLVRTVMAYFQMDE